ncbi:MAG: hypothetical protein ABW184_03295 [Sphingobium sp.]
MTGAISHNRNLRVLFCVLVALVLGARLLSPAGFMPVATPQGVMVTLCTGQGAVRMMVARDGIPESRLGHHKNNHHDDAGDASQHCPFAGSVSAPALPATAVTTALPVWHLPTGPIAFALKTGWIARIAAPPPPASGPPAILA